jgi:TRAP-type C4-dicarboxylate transport system permease small subunit
MLITIVKLIAVLAAALIVGNSFLAELKKARALGLPWYKPYLTLPGILILIAIFVVPVILKIMQGS